MKNIFVLLLLSLSIALTAQTVYITNTGEKYHQSGCRYLAKSKLAIELKDAIDDACKVCRPPTSVKTETISKDPGSETAGVQCSSITKAGTRCKRMTKAKTGSVKSMREIEELQIENE